MTPDLGTAGGWVDLAFIVAAGACVLALLALLGLAGNLAALARKPLPSPCARRNAGTGGQAPAPVASPKSLTPPERARTPAGPAQRAVEAGPAGQGPGLDTGRP